MATHLIHRLIIASLAATGVAACDMTVPWQSKGFWQCLVDFPAITDSIVKSSGYRIDYADVTGNRTHMQISIYDDKLVAADEPTRERAASVVVAAAEQALASRTGCATIEVISIGIYHPSAPRGPMHAWHLEDVVEFRKGPDQRFVLHAPSDAPRRTL
jgi:hypothetical protein